MYVWTPSPGESSSNTYSPTMPAGETSNDTACTTSFFEKFVVQNMDVSFGCAICDTHDAPPPPPAQPALDAAHPASGETDADALVTHNPDEWRSAPVTRTPTAPAFKPHHHQRLNRLAGLTAAEGERPRLIHRVRRRQAPCRKGRARQHGKQWRHCEIVSRDNEVKQSFVRTDVSPSRTFEPRAPRSSSRSARAPHTHTPATWLLRTTICPSGLLV